MIRLLSLLVLLIIPNIAYASESCIAPQSVMHLQGVDDKRLTLARSLKSYLSAHDQDPRLAKAIYKASLKTGVDFELMVLKAKLESDLGRATFAKTSTARGVFQYIEPTWLTLIKRYGDKLGYAHYADAIARPKFPGVPHLKTDNPFLKAEILALRHDPEMSAMIKAYQVMEETNVIRGYKNGHQVTAADHYIVHMLGLPLAREFYAMKNVGSRLALAKIRNPAMREAAKLNRVFFYNGKRPLTAAEVYAKFNQRVGKEFTAIHQAAFKNKTKPCAEKPAPEVTLASLETVKPLCSRYQADLQQPPSLLAALHRWHPCAHVRSH